MFGTGQHGGIDAEVAIITRNGDLCGWQQRAHGLLHHSLRVTCRFAKALAPLAMIQSRHFIAFGRERNTTTHKFCDKESLFEWPGKHNASDIQYGDETSAILYTTVFRKGEPRGDP